MKLSKPVSLLGLSGFLLVFCLLAWWLTPYFVPTDLHANIVDQNANTLGFLISVDDLPPSYKWSIVRIYQPSNHLELDNQDLDNDARIVVIGKEWFGSVVILSQTVAQYQSPVSITNSLFSQFPAELNHVLSQEPDWDQSMDCKADDSGVFCEAIFRYENFLSTTELNADKELGLEKGEDLMLAILARTLSKLSQHERQE